MHRPGVGVLFLLAVAAGSAAAATLIRGAAPDQLEKYQPVDGKFTCFDGSKSIDFGRVNDNFCDCPDSSDEPGTSACPNGVFYCRNRGHEPKLLASAFVDDGICDCCDGTDELSGCKNTCIEKNSATRDALKQKISAYKEALDKKATYAASAAGVRENIKQRFQNVDADIAAAESEMTRLTEERTRVEAETEEKRAQHNKEQAELAAKRKAEREAEAAKKAEEEKAAAEKAAAEQAAADAAAAQQAADAGGEQKEGGDASQEEETDEERGRRIAAQWTNDPAAAGAAGEGSPDEAADEPAEVTDGDQEGDEKGWSIGKAWSVAKDRVQKLIAKSDDADDAAGAGEEPAPEDEEPAVADDWGHEGESLHPDDYDASAGSDDSGSLAHDPDYQPFDESALQKVRRDLTAAEKTLADLRAEKERVMRQINYDFNDAWAGLLNKCLQSREPQFTYKFCFFDKAVQVDNGGGHETSLGHWKGFEARGTEAVFDAGDACGQHAPRSLRVKVECDGTERAWGASEPNVCAYVVHASTPAACKQDKLKELQGNLDALLAEEAALSRELEAEEAQRQRDLADMKARLGVGPDGHDEL